MPQWILDLLQTDRLLTVALIIFLLIITGKGLYKFFPFIAAFVGLVHTLVGDTSKGIPGIGERMEAQVVKLAELGEHLGEHGKKLETVRAQVQNSHGSNFRDDLDANTRATKEALRHIEQVAEKLDQHIGISKAKDAEQEQTARKVSQLAARWTPAE